MILKLRLKIKLNLSMISSLKSRLLKTKENIIIKWEMILIMNLT